jgi:hypothetical protein
VLGWGGGYVSRTLSFSDDEAAAREWKANELCRGRTGKEERWATCFSLCAAFLPCRATVTHSTGFWRHLMQPLLLLLNVQADVSRHNDTGCYFKKSSYGAASFRQPRHWFFKWNDHLWQQFVPIFFPGSRLSDCCSTGNFRACYTKHPPFIVIGRFVFLGLEQEHNLMLPESRNKLQFCNYMCRIKLAYFAGLS